MYYNITNSLKVDFEGFQKKLGDLDCITSLSFFSPSGLMMELVHDPSDFGSRPKLD